ncbi:MAG: DUF2752 domain-containing protein [Bacteriovoracaceae bacterium]|nr:DUF2752 domain-containing protein [Bacteriovoracaceae bacterium]
MKQNTNRNYISWAIICLPVLFVLAVWSLKYIVSEVPDPLTILPFKCPFRWITGLMCPTCGISHSIYHALHGQLLLSIKSHPLGLALIITVFINYIGFIVNKDRLYQLNKFISKRLILPNLGILVFLYMVWGVARVALS